MISVIVPAHNESAVIGRTLRALVTGAAPGELDVIVVCNGCTDDTANIARQFGPPVRVIETASANKTNALNLGDRAASGFPRVYVDADVVIALEAIRALVRRLNSGDVSAVAPKPVIDLQGCSWGVRAYYEVRSHLPSAREGIGGSGVYALSRDGRDRFGEFPNVVADDGFVRIQFKEKERDTLMHSNSVVFAPRSLRDLIRIRTRAYFGTAELAKRYPDLWENAGQRNHGAIIALSKSPSLWLKLLIYSYVNVSARYRAAALVTKSNFVWEKDNTSRYSVERPSDILGDQCP